MDMTSNEREHIIDRDLRLASDDLAERAAREDWFSREQRRERVNALASELRELATHDATVRAELDLFLRGQATLADALGAAVLALASQNADLMKRHADHLERTCIPPVVVLRGDDR